MSRSKRIPHFAYRGPFRYFLTICAHDRVRRFTDAVLVESAVRDFLRGASAQHMEITAYCVMPDHVHVPAAGLDVQADMCAFVAAAKQCTGWAFKRRTGGRLWQEGYYDRVLREHETTWAVVRYIVNNPVRAGMVEYPMAYPFWDRRSTRGNSCSNSF